LVREARAIIVRYEQALAALSARTPTSARQLRIGAPLEAPVGPVSSAIAASAPAYPQSMIKVVHLSTAEQIQALRNGALEVGLVREGPAHT
jgi:DNA-binding transcriptional LysR family regulator